MQTSRRLPKIPISKSATPRAKRPIQSISDADMCTLPPLKKSREPTIWRYRQAGPFTNKDDANTARLAEFRLQLSNIDDDYYARFDRYWAKVRKWGRAYPAAIHSAPSAYHIARKLALLLQRRWNTYKLNNLMLFTLVDVSRTHGYYQYGDDFAPYVNQALQRVRTYLDDPAEELDAVRQEFTKSLIFSKAAEGAWVTVPRLAHNANHLSLEDIDIV
jgi:hypothetical protein